MESDALAMDHYSALASEYYDILAHPTCNNFRFLSEQFLGESLLELWSAVPTELSTLEVGAGRSVIAPLLTRIRAPLGRLTLQDLSASMLQHSSEWMEEVRFLVGDARNVPLPDGSQSLVASSLGDPYNDEAFLDEVSRLLAAGGHFMITSPSEAWASAFRGRATFHDAEFIMRDGRSHYVPSTTWDPGQYIGMLELRGFMLRSFKSYQAHDVDGPLSPKLRIDGFVGPVIDGYWFQKI